MSDEHYLLQLPEWTLAAYQEAAAEDGIELRLVRCRRPPEMAEVAAWARGKYNRPARSIELPTGLAGDGAVIIRRDGQTTHIPAPDLPDPIYDYLPEDTYIFADVLCDEGPAPWIVVDSDGRITSIPSEPENENMLVFFVLGYAFRDGSD